MVDGPALAAPVTQANQVPTPYHRLEKLMTNEKGPNVKKKQKCKNCEGKGLVKKGDKVVKCQRCGGTGKR
jgi:DnaJ-class molecular chaperone